MLFRSRLRRLRRADDVHGRDHHSGHRRRTSRRRDRTSKREAAVIEVGELAVDQAVVFERDDMQTNFRRRLGVSVGAMLDWLIEKLELAIARRRQKQFNKWYATSWLGKRNVSDSSSRKH